MRCVKGVHAKLFLFSLCFCHSLFDCSGQFIKIGGIAVNVVKFGLEILDVVDDKKDDNGVVDKVNVVDQLKERISSSTNEIKTSIGLSSKLGLIDDAVIDIHSSLIDIENIVNSVSITERDEYVKLFIDRFEQNEVIKNIRFLPELLTYTIPGASEKLIDLVADNNRCNMTALEAFKTFYANLLADGISIHLLYLHLSTDLSLKKTIEKWNESLERVSLTFESKEKSCKESFPELAQEDVNSAIDAVRLWSDNKQRYPWKTSDVMFLKPYGTYQFIYHKSKENHLFWKKSSSRNKIAVFYNTNEHIERPEVLANASETIKSSIEGETDTEAALHVGQAVEEHLKDQGFSIDVIVVFFDGGDFSAEKIKLDEDSPVIKMTIEDVKLRYCYENVLGCVVDTNNWFGGTKEVNGKMREFVYVNDSDDEETSTYKTGSSIRHLHLSVTFYMLLILLLR